MNKPEPNSEGLTSYTGDPLIANVFPINQVIVKFDGKLSSTSVGHPRCIKPLSRRQLENPRQTPKNLLSHVNSTIS